MCCTLQDEKSPHDTYQNGEKEASGEAINLVSQVLATNRFTSFWNLVKYSNKLRQRSERLMSPSMEILLLAVGKKQFSKY